MTRKRKFLTSLPVARIKKIMQIDDEVGKVSVDTPFLIAKALEKFLSDLLEAASTIATAYHHKRIYPRHFKEIIGSKEQYSFLYHLVEKISGTLVPEDPSTGETVDKPVKKKKVTSDQQKSSSLIKRGRPKKAVSNNTSTSSILSFSLEKEDMLGSVPISYVHESSSTAFDDTNYD